MSTTDVTPGRPESRTAKDSRINLRVSSRQEQMIRRAATATDRSLTDFVLDSAAQHAERVLADRRWFVLSDEQFDEFARLLDAPFQPSDELRQLLMTEPSIDLSDV